MDYKLKYEKYKAKYTALKNKLSINQNGGSSKKPELYLFKADWCGHCKNFKTHWNSLQHNTTLKNKIKFVTVDSNEDANEIKQWKIQGYPTIILKNGSNAMEYNGERTSDKIIEFINDNVN